MSPNTKKYLTYAGIAGASGLAVYFFTRTPAVTVSKAPDSLGFVFPFTDEAALYDGAQAQIDKAKAGQPLDDYRASEDSQKFLTGAATDQEAYAKAAYWVAVAARIVRKAELTGYAEQLKAEADRFRLIPGSGSYVANIQTIYANAGKALRPYANKQSIAAIEAILGQSGSAGATETAQRAAQDRAVVANTAAKSGSNVATALSYARGVVTGEKPPGTTDLAWFVQKWGARAAIGVGVGAVAWGIWKWYGIGATVKRVAHAATSAAIAG